MMALHTLLLFIGAEWIFSATPGPAAMLVSAYGFRGGFGAAVAANLGIQTGNAIYIVISALGLGAVMAASAWAFTMVKLAGAAYLIALGLYTLWRAGEERGQENAKGHPYRQAVLTQLGNPKAILFFGAFLPQFLDPHRMLVPQYAEMFAIIMLGETLILGFYGWLGAQGRRLAGPRFALWRDRISGAAFVAIGTIFAAARRA
ncbi:MAG TPA: LysE family translocator [Rhizomicrobium sp.]|nr:LysE family translocator [Rhizomicrobium sp.]